MFKKQMESSSKEKEVFSFIAAGDFLNNNLIINNNFAFNENIVATNKIPFVTCKDILQIMSCVGNAVLVVISFWVLFVFAMAVL
jgi:hypothetical protein